MLTALAALGQSAGSGAESSIGDDPTLVVELASKVLLARALVAIGRSRVRTVSRVEGGVLVGSSFVFLALSAFRALGG